jgi:hypothetical protein
MHWKSYIGSSAVSIGALDATRDARKGAPVSLNLAVSGPRLWNHAAMVVDEARVVQAFCTWLEEHGWHTRVEVEHVDVVAVRRNQRFMPKPRDARPRWAWTVDTLLATSDRSPAVLREIDAEEVKND